MRHPSGCFFLCLKINEVINLICFTACACSIGKECIRDTAHLKQAHCKTGWCQRMLEKKKRVIDPKGMKKVKAIDYCERCGRMSNGFYILEVAHVKVKDVVAQTLRKIA